MGHNNRIDFRFEIALVAALMLFYGQFAGVSGFASSPTHTFASRTAYAPLILHRKEIVLATTKSLSILFESKPGVNNSSQEEDSNTLRSSLRKLTGFSLTALRATCRAATGISLTTIYLATVAATGAWIRQTTKFVLSIFPPWARYFVQPFLVLYYVPMFFLRNLTGPTRRQARKSHEAVLDSWKDAVQKADDTVAYWPIHVDEEGYIESDMGEIDLRDGVSESIEVAKDEADKKQAEEKK